MTENLFLEYRIEHPLHSGFHVFDGIVDDTVQTDVYVLSLRSLLCRRVRTHVKSDDNGIGCGCQRDIGLVNSSDAAMNNLNNNFFVGKLKKTLLHRFYRSLYIGFDNDIQLF